MTYSAQEQANLDLVLAMFRDVLEPLSSAQVDEYIAPGYIQHSQLAEPGREGLKAFLDKVGPNRQQATHDIKRIFADGDHVIVHYHVRRWPDDIGFAVMDIFRVADGLIQEHWDVMMDVPQDSPNPNSPF